MYLTEDQRNKLLKREELSPTERRDNEFAVRNKLKEFLEFVPDANLILSNLPKDQLKKNAKLANVLNNETTYSLFDLIFQLLNLLDFPVAYGSLQKPYAIKEDNYAGPYASRYEVPLSIKAQIERNQIETKTYPKLKQMTSEEYERILYINEYIQALIDNYQSDLILLDSIPLEMRAKKVIHPDTLSYSTLERFNGGLTRFNARLIRAIKEFGPIPEKELMLKLFTNSADKQIPKTFSVQLQELKAFGFIRKEVNGWRWATDQKLAQTEGITIVKKNDGSKEIWGVRQIRDREE